MTASLMESVWINKEGGGEREWKSMSDRDAEFNPEIDILNFSNVTGFLSRFGSFLETVLTFLLSQLLHGTSKLNCKR